MDSVTNERTARQTSPRAARAQPAMPPEEALEMPVQSLANYDRKARRSWQSPRNRSAPFLTRIVVFGGACALTIYGAEEMYCRDGHSLLDCSECILRDETRERTAVEK